MLLDQLCVTDFCVFVVYTVLLQLKEAMPLGEFLMAIRNMPTAHALDLQVMTSHRDTNKETVSADQPICMLKIIIRFIINLFSIYHIIHMHFTVKNTLYT